MKSGRLLNSNSFNCNILKLKNNIKLYLCILFLEVDRGLLAQSSPQGLDTGKAGVDGLALGLELCCQLLDVQFHLLQFFLHLLLRFLVLRPGLLLAQLQPPVQAACLPLVGPEVLLCGLVVLQLLLDALKLSFQVGVAQGNRRISLTTLQVRPRNGGSLGAGSGPSAHFTEGL